MQKKMMMTAVAAVSAYDWHRYMDFADRHGWRKNTLLK